MLWDIYYKIVNVIKTAHRGIKFFKKLVSQEIFVNIGLRKKMPENSQNFGSEKSYLNFFKNSCYIFLVQNSGNFEANFFLRVFLVKQVSLKRYSFYGLSSLYDFNIDFYGLDNFWIVV